MLTTSMETRDGVQVIHLSGALDSLAFDQFKDLLAEWVAKPTTRLVLDCQHLTFVNSQGLALLGSQQRLIVQNRSFMGIAGLNRRIVKTIEMLGLDRLVNLYPAVDEAVAAAEAS